MPLWARLFQGGHYAIAADIALHGATIAPDPTLAVGCSELASTVLARWGLASFGKGRPQEGWSQLHRAVRGRGDAQSGLVRGQLQEVEASAQWDHRKHFEEALRFATLAPGHEEAMQLCGRHGRLREAVLYAVQHGAIQDFTALLGAVFGGGLVEGRGKRQGTSSGTTKSSLEAAVRSMTDGFEASKAELALSGQGMRAWQAGHRAALTALQKARCWEELITLHQIRLL